MATSSTFAFPLRRNRYALSSVSLLLLLFLCLFVFSRRALESRSSIYGEVLSQTPVASLHLPLRSTAFHEKFGEIKQPISSRSNLDDIIDENTPFSSRISDSGFEEGSNEETTVLASSESGFNGETGQENTVPVISVEPRSQDVLEGNSEKPILSNEKTTVPVSSNSDPEETVESNTEGERFISNAVAEHLKNCDIYKGKWVKDEDYPLYRPGSCPYVDEAFDCQSNGRLDSEYLKWRWKPDGCDLPRFNAIDFLVRMNGRRLMLVGDSMNRNQFESLLCLLRDGLPDKNKMYEVHGYKITKGRGYYIFKFEDYNCTVEFVRSHFLVREGIRVNGQGNSNPTLSIDRIDKTAKRWKRADILVFNTGHWWTHGKTSRGKNYYKEGDYVYPRFDAVKAYRRAIETWAKWIKENVSQKKLVFYRGYSSAHFRGGDWDSGGTCNGETEPVTRGAILDSYPLKMRILEEVINEIKVPVVLLNVSHLTNFRKDGHPSVYGKNVTGQRKVSTRRQDCSHWCLPGVPDAWNELIYATLVARQTLSNTLY
ncbi:protein trichome birefringence-like 5 [Primulina tabacum]|uniref:protein trichome birefringence-like 5 n=1 Tax=Primulina tabacum TaxID=48773 RepID=UPI003F5A2176